MKKGIFNFTRALALFVCAVFCVCLVHIFGRAGGKTPSAFSPSPSYLVVIDAGHGGIDGGVRGVGTGVLESDVNLAIALKTKAVFNQSGIQVVLTRKNSGGLYGNLSAGHKKRDMQARRQIIMDCNPTLVISIHQNQYASSLRRGGQVFFKRGCDKSQRLAGIIQSGLNQISGTGRDYDALTGDYYLLEVSPCPAVIVECGFLSNPEDERLLLSGDYQALIASSVYDAVVQFFASERVVV